MSDVAADAHYRALGRRGLRARARRRLGPQGGGRASTVNGQRQLPFAPSLGIPTATQNGIHVKLAGAGDQVLAGPRCADQAVRVQARAGVRRLLVARLRAGGARDAPRHDLGLAAPELLRRLPADRPQHPRRRLHRELARAASRPQRAARLEPRRRRPRPLPPLPVRRAALQAGRLLQSRQRARRSTACCSWRSPSWPCSCSSSSRRAACTPCSTCSSASPWCSSTCCCCRSPSRSGFALAYLIAAAASGGMLSIYVGKVLASRTRGLTMVAVFAVALRPALPDPEPRGLRPPRRRPPRLRRPHHRHVRHPARRLVRRTEPRRATPATASP